MVCEGLNREKSILENKYELYHRTNLFFIIEDCDKDSTIYAWEFENPAKKWQLKICQDSHFWIKFLEAQDTVLILN